MARGAKVEALEGRDEGVLAPGLYLTPPSPYLEFLRLMRGAAMVLTDSGGVQEETTILRIPCGTLRPNTERPITVSLGTNELLDRTPSVIVAAVERALAGEWKEGGAPPLWDGRAAARIVDALRTWMAATPSFGETRDCGTTRVEGV